MNIYSVLGFPATVAGPRAHVAAFVDEQPARTPARASERFEIVSVVVASRDALQARRALLVCPDTTILRCVPMHWEDKVKLEIRFPAGQGNAVISRVLAGVPAGEISGIVACANLRARAHLADSNKGERHGH